MLFTKCIYLPRSFGDGLRVSVMLRHTLPDGVTPDPRIPAGHYDRHWPELGPPPRILDAYLRGEMDWSDFERRFLAHLEVQRLHLDELIRLALGQNVTLLCCEINLLPKFMVQGKLACHRRLIAEECRRRHPGLAIDVR